MLSILSHSKQKFRGEPSESANVSPLSISFVQVSPKEVDNPSVSAIREAREEAGVIGNEKRERRQKLMSEGGGKGSPSLLVRCQTQHTGQLKEREREREREIIKEERERERKQVLLGSFRSTSKGKDC